MLALRERTITPFWVALLVLATLVYALGLNGQYVPSNGDELVYAHIARKTAETGHWLPLASELVDTRNTKPPMLFWQAMVAGHWGESWTLAALRTPSLVYLLLISAAIVACLRLATQRWREGLMAAAVFLAFLSTFRYVRPYLTSAPESFWFSLPLFALLWQRTARAGHTLSAPGWLAHVLLGVALGIGLLYKSFALVAPAAASWWLALVMSEPMLSWRIVLRHTLRVGISAVIALGVFGLWFVVDPDPQAVWREFIVAENVGKFEDKRGWFYNAFALSGSSIWSQLLAYGVNAGLLVGVAFGLMWLGLRSLRQARSLWPWPAHHSILVAWALVWLLVFMLPDQRSARYVIPAMPAFAMLIALHWQRIARAWFALALLLAAGAVVLLGRIAWVGHELDLSSRGEFTLVVITLLALSACVIGGLVRSAWTRGASVAAALLTYASFGLITTPLDGPVGLYSAETIARAPQGRIAVPNGFNSQFERFQFLLPGDHHFEPYATGARRSSDNPLTLPEELQELLGRYNAVVWIQHDSEITEPPCLPHCEVLGKRWLITSRHLAGDIRPDNLWYPQQWLYRREWLLVKR